MRPSEAVVDAAYQAVWSTATGDQHQTDFKKGCKGHELQAASSSGTTAFASPTLVT
jgi:hypothetical protein